MYRARRAVVERRNGGMKYSEGLNKMLNGFTSGVQRIEVEVKRLKCGRLVTRRLRRFEDVVTRVLLAEKQG
jgi:hypothetical protein